MIRNKPEVDQDKRYNVKEFSDKLCVCRETIRKYTIQEVIVPIRITSREIYYLGSEILILWEVLTNRKSAK